MNQYFFKVPFGLSGDQTVIPQPTQPGGDVSFDQGYGPDYSLANSNPSSKKVPRGATNWLYYVITQQLQQYQSFGYPEFITSTDNGGTPYSYQKDATVHFYDGANWHLVRSLVDANTTVPLTDATTWEEIGVNTLMDMNYLTGLITSNDTGDALHDIAIETGACNDATNVIGMYLNSAIAKQIDVTWAAGGVPTAATGGMAPGLTVANNTWYRLFLIAKPDGTVNAGFDTSATAANLLTALGAPYLAGYRYYRQIAWVRYGTATIIQYIQNDDMFTWATPIDDVLGTASQTAQLRTLTVPPDSKCVARINYFAEDNGAHSSQNYVLITSLDQPDVAPTSSAYNFYWRSAGAGTFGSGSFFDVNSSSTSQIRTRSSEAFAAIEAIATVGWIDRRGA